MSITIRFLNIREGGKELHFNDVTPEDRDALAKEILRLLKKSFLLFVKRGDEEHQITGYDKKTHEWIILADASVAGKTEKVRMSAQSTKVHGMPQLAGG